LGVAIDADIVNGAFREALGSDTGLTGSVADTLNRMRAHGLVLVVDATGHMRHEWAECTEREWIDAWYLDLVSRFRVIAINADLHRDAIKRCRVDHGLPNSRDKWLIRTSISDAESGTCGTAIILTEDCDLFHPPSKKKPAQRMKLLRGDAAGPLARYLAKKHGVHVKSLALMGTWM
jgi:hypothetical protein